MSTQHQEFSTLVEQNKPILYKVANSYCREPDDRPDLIQEILIQLWLSFARFDGRVKFSTWMYRIALNVAISFYRSGRRHDQANVPLAEIGLELATTDRLLSEFGDELRLLYQAIGRLNEIQRALILLHLDGYKNAEIAEMMGMSVTNVSTSLSRTRQQLMAELTVDEKEQQETKQ